MKNQNTKLVAHGAEIQVTPAGSVYVTIKERTIYFENDICGIDISTWSKHDEPDTSIDLWSMKAEEAEYEAKIKALKEENRILAEKNKSIQRQLNHTLECQKTSIFWDAEDVFHFMQERPEKYKNVRLTESQCRDILIVACTWQEANEGLTWSILEGYIDCYLLNIGPFCKK